MNEATITTSHTPGPWTTDGHFVKRGGTILAEAFTTQLVDQGPNEQPANAHLIAEAPAMYAWLKKHYGDEEGIGETDRPAYAELRAILARIDGSPK